MLAVCVPGGASAAKPDKGPPKVPNLGRPITDQYLVTLDAASTPDDVIDDHDAGTKPHGCGLANTKKFSTVNAFVVKNIPKPKLECLESHVGGVVADIEQDTYAEVSDWLFPAPWGLDRIDQRGWPLDIAYWRGDTGAGARVYVVDTGVLASHEEFGGRVEAGGVAPGTDDNGHGTHVAGIIAGQNVGVAPGARVVSVKVLDTNGEAPVSDVIAGLDWVFNDHSTRPAPSLVNMSLSASPSKALNAAVAKLVDAGVPVVVAAGNSGTSVACASPRGSVPPATSVSPASESSAITVGATAEFDVRPSDSNFGPCLDIFAPGVRIESSDNDGPGSRALRSGTSMATAFVSGALARLMSPTTGPAPADPAKALLDAGLTGVVANRGSGSPDKFLYTGSGPGAFTPPATDVATPATTSRPAAPEEAAARQIAPPRITRVRYSASGRRIILWISYDGSGRIEVLRDDRVVMRTVRRRVTVRAGNDRRDVLRLRAMDPGVASVRPGRRSNRAVRVFDSVRIVRG